MCFQALSADHRRLFEVDNEALKTELETLPDSFLDWFFICPRYIISFLSESLND